MRDQSKAASLALVLFLHFSVTAATRYVDLNSPGPLPPYTGWSTAATNIQDAIDAAAVGDLILVTNGVYAARGKVMGGDLTNRVALDKAVIVQSVNGPWETFIHGAGATNGTAAVRCAWLTNGASLVGFTLQGGATRLSGDSYTLRSGGGVWCASANAIVANCVIVSNAASLYGGGGYQGTMNNCYLRENSASLGGGSCNGVLNSCTVVSNSNYGVYQAIANLAKLTNCIVFHNRIGNYAGGVACSYCCTTPLPSGAGNFTNAPQLFVDDVQLSMASPCIGAGTNRVTGTDIFGRAWSNPPSVGCAEWQAEPVVTKPRVALTADPVGFTVGNAAANGEPPLAYFWLKDGAALQDDGHFSATRTANLVAAGVMASDWGSYQLVASNAFGMATSEVARLVIRFADVAAANPSAPYTNWATAATAIQEAIDAAQASEVVLVTNGVYAAGGKAMAGDLTNRVALDKSLTVVSVNGAARTTIQGAWDPATTNGPLAVRSAWLTDGALLSGFTLRDGATRATGDTDSLQSGGGVWAASTNAAVLCCILTNNSAIRGGGASSGTLNNCAVLRNQAVYGGGCYNAAINNCLVVGNWTTTFQSSRGAGTYNGTSRNSIVWENYLNYGRSVLENYASAVMFGADYSYCCTSPPKSGLGNISGDPQFLDRFHLSTTSPCRGAGSPLHSTGSDVDGESWANPPSIGCDEVVESALVGPLEVGLLAWQTNTLAGQHYLSFVGQIAGRASRLAWSFEDGAAVTNGDYYISHAWANPGLYHVTFTAYNADNPAGISTNVAVVVVPINQPVLESPLVASNAFQFGFSAQTGARYTVQYATNLAPPVTWQTQQIIYYSPGGATRISDPSWTNAARFYRVLAQ